MKKNLYALVGEVKYEQVRGDGYLEMWNDFSPLKPGMPEGHYFSRTLGISGEMGKLIGTSDWRKFMLPFDRTGTSNLPVRLEFNLFLPAQGTVYLGSMKLVEFSGSFSAGRSSPIGWWSDRTSGLVGGVGGATLGCLASLLAWLASRGRARAFVLTTLKALISLGVVLSVAGVAALGLHQPYAVWFVLLLPGVLLVGIFIPRLRQFQKAYEALEMRRMASLDTLGG